MTNDLAKPHTIRHFDQELEQIKSTVLSMGGLVERQLLDALDAFDSRDSQLAETVIGRDCEINTMERDLDEECTTLLARRHPFAVDLRMVLAVTKTVNDLERMGDEIKIVCRATVGLISSASNISPEDVPRIRRMGENVAAMLRKCLDALARLDPDAAQQVTRDDLEVDEDYSAAVEQLLRWSREPQESVEPLLHLSRCAQALERIGDRCRNIGEYVVFLVEGTDIRHQND